MTANTLAIILLAVLVLILLVTNLSMRNTARGVVSRRETLDNEAFSRRFFTGREARLASAVRAALAPYIPIDVAHAYPDDDLINALKLGAVEGMTKQDFIASLERLYNIEIPAHDAQALYTLRHIIAYLSRRLAAVEATNGQGSSN